MNVHKRRAGFTLIELLISVMILAIGVLSVMSLFPVAIFTVNDSMNTTSGSIIASNARSYLTYNQAADELNRPPVNRDIDGDTTFTMYPNLYPEVRYAMSGQPGNSVICLFDDRFDWEINIFPASVAQFGSPALSDVTIMGAMYPERDVDYQFSSVLCPDGAYHFITADIDTSTWPPAVLPLDTAVTSGYGNFVCADFSFGTSVDGTSTALGGTFANGSNQITGLSVDGTQNFNEGDYILEPDGKNERQIAAGGVAVGTLTLTSACVYTSGDTAFNITGFQADLTNGDDTVTRPNNLPWPEGITAEYFIMTSAGNFSIADISTDRVTLRLAKAYTGASGTAAIRVGRFLPSSYNCQIAVHRGFYILYDSGQVQGDFDSSVATNEITNVTIDGSALTYEDARLMKGNYIRRVYAERGPGVPATPKTVGRWHQILDVDISDPTNCIIILNDDFKDYSDDAAYYTGAVYANTGMDFEISNTIINVYDTVINNFTK